MSAKKAWIITVLFLIFLIAIYCVFFNKQSSSYEVVGKTDENRAQEILEINENKSQEVAKIEEEKPQIILEAEEKKSQIILEVNQKEPKKGESVNLSVHAENIEVAAGTLWLYFDSQNLEVIKKPENSNVVNNTIVYTWFNDNGKNRSGDFEITEFTFKAKNDGISIFTVQAELYNQEGNEIKVNVEPTEIQIGENITQMQDVIEQSQTLEDLDLANQNNLEDLNSNNQDNLSELLEIEKLQNDDENNTNLAIMRLNYEGINPVFDKNIKEYYITIPENINNLEVTAIPENENSTVTITGNQNLKNGANTIQINVQSENEKNNSKYQIFVTKTNNINASNTNLETLAIENATIAPEYQEQVTNYRVSVANNVESLNILAIPQNQNAEVEIRGNDNLKEGDNTITITVTAENGVTFKKYIIVAYKMSEQEMKEKEENIQTEQSQNGETIENGEENKINETENVTNSNVIDNAKNIENKLEENKEAEKINYFFLIGGIIAVLIVIGALAIIKKNRYYN